MRGIFGSSAAAILVGALFVGGAFAADPPVVPPISEALKTSCETNNFRIEMSGGFPVSNMDCYDGSTLKSCTKYSYFITNLTGLNVDHTVFSVSANQKAAFSTNNSPTTQASISAPGQGDNTTGFLAAAQHEYAVRFNSQGQKSNTAHIYIIGPSSPRMGTVLVRSGTKTIESCLISTPGVTGNPFQPTIANALVAGGKCNAIFKYDGAGNVVDVTTDTPGCFSNDATFLLPPRNGVVLVNGAPLKNNASSHGITFGENTTTCYGPPIPSVPKCICTALPCP